MVVVFLLLISIFLVIADVIVFITSKKLHAGTFIRKMRYMVYSVTPARRIFIMLIFGIAGKISGSGLHDVLIMEILLFSGMLLAYSENILTLRNKQKKRIPAKRVKKIRQEKG